MVKTKTQSRLADRLKAAAKRRKKSWFDKTFPPGNEHREELLAIREEFLKGEYDHLDSMNLIWELVNEEIKLGVKVQAFERWLRNET